MTKKNKPPSEKNSDSNQQEKPNLTAEDIEQFKQMLLDKRKEIVGNVSEMQDEALKKSRLDATGDLSSMPIHMADVGSDTFEQEFALELMDSERKLLEEIDAALQRIEENRYGICEGTGKPIPKARLKAQPWARYCVEYARMLEKERTGELEQQPPASEGEAGPD